MFGTTVSIMVCPGIKLRLLQWEASDHPPWVWHSPVGREALTWVRVYIALLYRAMDSIFVGYNAALLGDLFCDASAEHSAFICQGWEYLDHWTCEYYVPLQLLELVA